MSHTHEYWHELWSHFNKQIYLLKQNTFVLNLFLVRPLLVNESRLWCGQGKQNLKLTLKRLLLLSVTTMRATSASSASLPQSHHNANREASSGSLLGLRWRGWGAVVGGEGAASTAAARSARNLSNSLLVRDSWGPACRVYKTDKCSGEIIKSLLTCTFIQLRTAGFLKQLKGEKSSVEKKTLKNTVFENNICVFFSQQKTPQTFKVSLLSYSLTTKPGMLPFSSKLALYN